jgi:hypothetical protein
VAQDLRGGRAKEDLRCLSGCAGSEQKHVPGLPGNVLDGLAPIVAASDYDIYVWNRDSIANLAELLVNIVHRPASPLLDDEVFRRTLDLATEYRHRPHGERHDPQLDRPLGGQLDSRRDKTVDVGFASVRDGEPSYRIGPQRVAARSDRNRHCRGVDQPFGDAAQRHPPEQSRRR